MAASNLAACRLNDFGERKRFLAEKADNRGVMVVTSSAGSLEGHLTLVKRKI